MAFSEANLFRHSPKGDGEAPEVGFEPTTIRLTVGRSTTELLRNLECEGRTTCLSRLQEATDFVRIFADYFGGLTDRGVVLSLRAP